MHDWKIDLEIFKVLHCLFYGVIIDLFGQMTSKQVLLFSRKLKQCESREGEHFRFSTQRFVAQWNCFLFVSVPSYDTTTEQAFVPGHLSRQPLGPGQ